MALWLTDGVVHLEEILCSWIWNNPRFVTGSNWSKTVDEGKEHWESNWYTRDSGCAHANVTWINTLTACSRKVFRRGNIFELSSKPHFWVKGRVFYIVWAWQITRPLSPTREWRIVGKDRQAKRSGGRSLVQNRQESLAPLLPKRETFRRLVTRGGCCSYYWFKLKLFTVGDY